MSETNDSNSALMYLPASYWSARYDRSFYTVKVEGNVKISDDLPSTPSVIRGKDRLPAFYYKVVVYREHETSTVLRRYSHFYWLYQQLLSNPPVVPAEQGRSAVSIKIPPGTCPLYFRQDNDFANNRQQLLAQFLEDVLSQPGYAKHEAVVQFLELH